MSYWDTGCLVKLYTPEAKESRRDERELPQSGLS